MSTKKLSNAVLKDFKANPEDFRYNDNKKMITRNKWPATRYVTVQYHQGNQEHRHYYTGTLHMEGVGNIFLDKEAVTKIVDGWFDRQEDVIKQSNDEKAEKAYEAIYGEADNSH